MSEQKQRDIILTDDQKDALVQSFFPVMLEFFQSDKGKKSIPNTLKIRSVKNRKPLNSCWLFSNHKKYNLAL